MLPAMVAISLKLEGPGKTAAKTKRTNVGIVSYAPRMYTSSVGRTNDAPCAPNSAEKLCANVSEHRKATVVFPGGLRGRK